VRLLLGNRTVDDEWSDSHHCAIVGGYEHGGLRTSGSRSSRGVAAVARPSATSSREKVSRLAPCGRDSTDRYERTEG
jgi:hypothetical protein